MRSNAQRGALILSIAFLLAGFMGLFVENGMAMAADPATSGLLLGLFPVNLIHNVVHLALGAWGLVASRSTDASRLYGRVGAGIYAALVVIAFLSPTLFGLAPIGGNDIWLHAVFAAALAWIGFTGATRTATA
jgi:hypothetical protein